VNFYHVETHLKVSGDDSDKYLDSVTLSFLIVKIFHGGRGYRLNLFVTYTHTMRNGLFLKTISRLGLESGWEKFRYIRTPLFNC
jgi:hypothetical protein